MAVTEKDHGVTEVISTAGFLRLKKRLGRAASSWVALLFVVLLISSTPARAYSVLTHEEIVDILWKDEIVPLLLKRFPAATKEQLRKAHAYAYGGCLIQDVGYYPFGNRFFSDLVHYVRTGDFVANLIEESADLDQYAFALGALAHYSADNCGHPTVNRVVAMTFPKLQAKYGKEVTYGDDPKSHIRTEFGFDLVQVAKQRYTSDRYHDFIGFEVSKPLLERAFLKTYDLRLEEVLGHVDLAIGTFRRAVSEVIPEMTRVALIWKRLDIVQETPNFSESKFRYYLSRSEYEKEWGKEYRRPGFMARVLAFTLRWIPKVGPLRAMAFQIPTTEAEDLYIKSVNKTVENYRGLLHQVAKGQLNLPNMDCDTGRDPRVGEYALSDQTYLQLLQYLSKHDFESASPELRQNIIAFYRNLDVPVPTKKQAKAWRKALEQLQNLKGSGQQPSMTGRTRR